MFFFIETFPKDDKKVKRSIMQWTKNQIPFLRTNAILICAMFQVTVTCAILSKNYLPKMKVNLKIPAIDGVFPGIGLEFIWGKTVMKQVSAGMTVPEGSARELPLGEDWVEPIALFFQCKGVLWQDMARDGNHLIIRGPKLVDQGILDRKPSLWNKRRSRKEFWENKF